MKRILGWVFLASAAGLIGCGDDDGGSNNDTDSGPIIVDAGRTDSGGDSDSGAGDAGEEDAGPVVTNECNPFMEGSCSDGRKCSVVIKQQAEGEDALVFYGCVSASVARGEGITCSFGVEGTPDVTGDEAVADNCAQGLFCASGDSGGRFCERMCNAEEEAFCNADEACLLANQDPDFGICDESDNCDVVAQTGCAGDENCYLYPNGVGGFVSRCFEQSIPDGGTGTAGSPCMYLDTCERGTGCFATRLPDGGLNQNEYVCTPFCAFVAPSGADAGVADAGGVDAGVADMDAGVAMDAGAATGGCSSSTMCEMIETADGGVFVTPTVPGVCR